MVGFGIRALYPKLHHGTRPNPDAIQALDQGWAREWRARGALVIGWGFLEGALPEAQAATAVELCKRYDLDGYIANAEFDFEGVGWYRSKAFCQRFRQLAPTAPLALSYIGYGYPHRNMDFQAWRDAGASFMPQCYTARDGHSVEMSVVAADRAGIPRDSLMPTIATSDMDSYYPVDRSVKELESYGTKGCSVWLLDSTNDDPLRVVGGARSLGIAA